MNPHQMGKVSSRAFCIILFTLWKKVCILSVWLYGLKYCVVLINNQMEHYWSSKTMVGTIGLVSIVPTKINSTYICLISEQHRLASTFYKESQSKPFATKRTMKLHKNLDFLWKIKTLTSKFQIFRLSRPIPSCPDPENIRIRQKNIRHGPMSLEP